MAKNLTPAEEHLLEEAGNAMVLLMQEHLNPAIPPLLAGLPKDKHEALARLLHCAADVMRERRVFVDYEVLVALTDLLGRAAKATTRTPGAASHSHYVVILSDEEYVRLAVLCNLNGASDADQHSG